MLYRGQKEALAEFLPLDAQNWITCGNALRLDWLSICPPTGTGVKHHADDLFHTPLDQAQIDFENEGGETYICGNPPYLGSTWQSEEQKSELQAIFDGRTKSWKSLDYVAAWFMKAADYWHAHQCGSGLCVHQFDLSGPAGADPLAGRFSRQDMRLPLPIPPSNGRTSPATTPA